MSREEIASKLVASYIFEPDVASFTEDLMASEKRSDDFDMIELRVSSKNPYLSKDYDFAFADIRSSYSSVLFVIYKNNKLHKNPTEPITILENDYLIIMTNGNNSSKLKEDFGVEEGRF